MTRPLRVQLLATICAGLAACAGRAADDAAPHGGGEAMDSGGTCTFLEELALSPRPDAEAEELAFESAGTLTARTDDYLRIQADLASIRAQVPEVAAIHARASWTMNMVSRGVDEVGFAAMNAGTYDAWDCVNARYGSSGWKGGSSSFTTPPTNSVTIELGLRRLNIPLVVEAYSSLPHQITWIGPQRRVGDGDDVCASQSGDTYSYVFKKGEGDCPSGCTEITYWGFSTSPGGTVTTLGKSAPDASGPGPAWLRALEDCQKWL